ncbi:C40 family peptidase [Spongisporangium articulatum]|uniref:C40 family peptidase n=1 Tax=Spongisporangium articulatum TaxID=3362603 RepID=A0ABW8AVJ1_9ACTN
MADAITGQLTALTSPLTVVGKTGLVLTMSSGLIAGGAIPALAGTTAAATTGRSAEGGMVTAAMPASALAMASSLSVQNSGLTAPAAAQVTFEKSAFKAIKSSARPASAETSAGAAGSSAGSAGTVAPGAAVNGSAVLAIAARYVGTPYLYGGTTPNGFDCSGYTGYVYRQLGVSLPRTADQQLNATRQISRADARPGDLVFFVSGGRAYHNGIYAGGNLMYDSPRSGKSVSKRDIWSADVVFTRVTG